MAATPKPPGLRVGRSGALWICSQHLNSSVCAPRAGFSLVMAPIWRVLVCEHMCEYPCQTHRPPPALTRVLATEASGWLTRGKHALIRASKVAKQLQMARLRMCARGGAESQAGARRAETAQISVRLARCERAGSVRWVPAAGASSRWPRATATGLARCGPGSRGGAGGSGPGGTR